MPRCNVCSDNACLVHLPTKSVQLSFPSVIGWAHFITTQISQSACRHLLLYVTHSQTQVAAPPPIIHICVFYVSRNWICATHIKYQPNVGSLATLSVQLSSQVASGWAHWSLYVFIRLRSTLHLLCEALSCHPFADTSYYILHTFSCQCQSA